MASPQLRDGTDLYIEQVRFGKEEIERRKDSPVYTSGDEIARAHAEADHIVYIVDPRIGYNNHTHRFWINRLPPGGEEGQAKGGPARWKTLGHRHTVEAVIHWLQGHGHSVIDGKRYDWEAGDFICVPMFSWHRHVNTSDGPAIYVASTTGPLSQGIGQAVYEDELYPEFWVFAQQGEDAMKTLVPGGAEAPPELTAAAQGESQAARLYAEQVRFAFEEEHRRRASRVMVKSHELQFEPTAMGRLAYVVDSRIGFHVKALATVVAEIPPGRHSGAHRHLYDEIDYVLAGQGRAIIDDQTYEIKKGDALAIPVFAWHQYFNDGDEPMRILAHSARPAMENLGLVLTQQGELADY
jgi:gentisate 1,2-dioxygenase